MDRPGLHAKDHDQWDTGGCCNNLVVDGENMKYSITAYMGDVIFTHDDLTLQQLTSVLGNLEHLNEKADHSIEIEIHTVVEAKVE